MLRLDDSGAISNRYLQGPAVDQILADENALGEVLWPLADNQGTIRDLASYNSATAATTIANHITYSAFGAITSETNAAVDHIFAYTGRERDEESDLQFNRARYYDPILSQFIGEDPLSFAAGDANLRRYVGNNATNATDPSGLEENRYRGFSLGFFNAINRRNEELDRLAQPTLGGTFERIELKPSWGATNAQKIMRSLDDSADLIVGTTEGAADGAQQGLVVTGDAITLHLIVDLHERSTRYQQEALDRGDIITQIGFGAGEVGAGALHLAVGVFSAGAKGGAVLITTYGGATGAMVVSTSAATLSSPLVTIPVTAGLAYIDYNKSRVHYFHEKNGYYITAVDAGGSAGIDLIFAGSIVRTLSPRLQPARNFVIQRLSNRRMATGATLDTSGRAASQLARRLSYLEAEALAKSEATGFAARLRDAARTTGRRIPSKASAVVDLETGRAYHGISLGNKASLQPIKIHPELARQMPAESLERWRITNCAEFNACNRALHDGAKWGDLRVYTVDVRRGVPVPRCANCAQSIDGLIVPSL